MYTPERLTKIAVEAAREGSSFSFNDRIGLVYDAFALAQAGFAKLSSAFSLVDILRNEQECEFPSSNVHYFLVVLTNNVFRVGRLGVVECCYQSVASEVDLVGASGDCRASRRVPCGMPCCA